MSLDPLLSGIARVVTHCRHSCVTARDDSSPACITAVSVSDVSLFACPDMSHDPRLLRYLMSDFTQLSTFPTSVSDVSKKPTMSSACSYQKDTAMSWHKHHASTVLSYIQGEFGFPSTDCGHWTVMCVRVCVCVLPSLTDIMRINDHAFDSWSSCGSNSMEALQE
jgi:hypothetical protein